MNWLLKSRGTGRRSSHSVSLALATVFAAALLTSGCDPRIMEAEGLATPGESPDLSILSSKGSSAEEIAAEQRRGGGDADSSAPSDAVPSEAEEYIGTGVFVRQTRVRKKPSGEAPAGNITFNFADTDIREVIQTVLGNILQANYTIHPNVQGTVTIRTSEPLAREAVIPTLESLLRLNNVALVDDNGQYRVEPMEGAARTGIALQSGRRVGPARKGFGLRVVPLRYVAAPEMQKILEPMVAANAIMNVDAARNLMILSGTQAELDNMVETVRLFDVDWLRGNSFALYPVQTPDVEKLSGELSTIFGLEEESPMTGMVQFLPIERLSSILVISKQPIYLKQAGVWIDRLDRGEVSAGKRLFVYYVQNGRAVDLATVLKDIFQGETTTPVQAELAPGLAPAEIGDANASQDTDNTGQQSAASQPQAAEAAAPAPTPISVRAVEGAIDVADIGEVRIIADEASNALVILASARDYRMIESAIRKLDVVPLQVMIEATIADVTLTDDLRYGIQWFLQSGNFSGTLSSATGGTVSQVFPGFSFLYAGGQDARSVLNALTEVTNVRMISSPLLMVLDNQSATLQVGDEVPVATRQSQSVTDPDAPITTTIQFRNTGVILTVTPRVNAGGLVTMEIEQEVSDVTETTTSGLDSPTIRQRKISSTVAVQSGESVALGGLIRTTKTISKSGVPFLSEVPLLGALFRNTSNDDTRTELIVILTPRVIRNAKDAREITDELRRRMQAITKPGVVQR